jgi:hypothetical protein
MRRVSRWVFDAITILSLILCIATSVLWVRSQRAQDGVGFGLQWKSSKLHGQDGWANDEARWESPPMQGYGITIESVASHLGIRLSYDSLQDDPAGPPSDAGERRPRIEFYELKVQNPSLLPPNRATWRRCGFYFLDDVYFPFDTTIIPGGGKKLSKPPLEIASRFWRPGLVCGGSYRNPTHASSEKFASKAQSRSNWVLPRLRVRHACYTRPCPRMRNDVLFPPLVNHLTLPSYRFLCQAAYSCLVV